MKRKFIKEDTFGFYLELVWNCTEEEFVTWVEKKYKFQAGVKGSFGKTVRIDGKTLNIFLWLKRKENIETLAHELIHIVRFWLEDYQGTKMCQETEEVYTTLHSFFMNKCLRILGLEKFIAK